MINGKKARQTFFMVGDSPLAAKDLAVHSSDFDLAKDVTLTCETHRRNVRTFRQWMRRVVLRREPQQHVSTPGLNASQPRSGGSP